LVDDVLHEHGSGHWAYSTGVRGKVFGNFFHVGVNIAEKH
jgi:hypothetical protein